MATKKQKRIAGELKAAKQREETRASGLKAQREDQIKREQMFQNAAIARDRKAKKEQHLEATSKIAQEKKDRVAKRLAEKDSIDLKRDVVLVEAMSEAYEFGMHELYSDPESLPDYSSTDVKLVEKLFPEFNNHDDALDLSSVDC